jgi:LacI family gluconate utilization system Gnt-I transcriptional repressor
MLSYIPSGFSGNPSSKVVGVIVPSLANAVFVDVLRGIHDILGAAGYRVLVANSHYSSREEEKMVRTLLTQSAEAMIITGGDQTSATQTMLQVAEIPVVQIMELLEEPLDNNVGFSHWQAGYDITQHLLEEGYGYIGFIGAHTDTRVQQRIMGYKAALEEKGRYWKNFVITTSGISSAAVGGELFKSLMETNNNVLDAVFCANDDLALGALFESQRMKIAVPDDMAICGFNDIELASLANPSLTSVYVNRYEMGIKAAEMVLKGLRNEPISEKKIDIGYEIKRRASSCRDDTENTGNNLPQALRKHRHY